MHSVRAVPVFAPAVVAGLGRPESHADPAAVTKQSGFTSYVAWLPGDSLTEAFVAAVLGRSDPMTVPYPGDLRDLAGRYQDSGRGADRVLDFTIEDGALTLKGNGPPQTLIHLGNGVFGQRSARYAFIRQGSRVTGVQTNHVSINGVLARQVAPGRCA